ncbi:TIGR03915 family putative DNA repair protein [Terrisporobacter mayombei]|uniref:DUF4130 domain-containing protein n=1 Tax=Terrisporobacter mayombei TaxID=1541 RepID=A0ABY9Q017_9FIRM|nr:TIGR03915 family putative DNA repair protein [Terrisporobacter mayombei]MCC3868607.1 TIGR03915 family putative DNA repair protein [Terrisporobacter mayombei]WMT80764.1 hypothetical protein TEMA_10860 [Terrisporobacter mayombei]
MRVFLHEQTFEGLLSAIYDAYYLSTKPDFICSKIVYEQNLIDEVITIKSDNIKFEKVYNAIVNKISREALNKIYYVFLSETKESSNLIYKYLRMGFKFGKDVELYINNDIVLNMDKVSNKVAYECHRLTGFIRFKEINNILYASINPDYNILPILGNHFKKRLSNENFIIHDIKRDTAFIYDKEDYYLTNLSKTQKNILMNSDDKGEYENLWKQYFKSINIEERRNPRLQKKMMPTRYWNNIVEVNNK